MFYGERIRMRKLERDDLPQFVDWLNDPEVRAGISIYLPVSQVEEENWFEEVVKRPAYEHPLAVEILDGDGWRLIGNSGLFSFDWRARKAEFGIMVGDKSVWGRGYGTEITRMMLKIGFEVHNLNKVMLRVMDSNPRARHVYEKVGYKYEGTHREDDYLDGKYIDMHFYSVLRSEWDAGLKDA